EVARQALGDADVVVLVVEATAGVTPADGELARGLAALARPTVVVLSKLDLVRPPVLLPAMEALGTLLPGREIIPVGARTGDNVRVVLDAVVKALPEGPRLYPEDEYTAESERFLAQELIREQLFCQTEEEIPYGTAVQVEEFSAKADLLVVRATILVDRPNHKGIVIGARGTRLGEIGRRARLELEAALGTRVFLELFVRAEPGWVTAGPPRDRAALAARVRAQTLAAVAEADCVLCVLDGAAGLAPEDRETVRLLRRSGKPVVYAVNKLDTPGRDPLLHDFQALGVEPLLPVSAAHGRGVAELFDALGAALPEAAPEAPEARGTRLALIGRPNVGKSSLLNRLLGAERTIVAPEPGTTRDAIDTPLVVAGRPYVLIDTAGIRRRGKVREPLERHGAVRALGTLARADLVLVVLDAAEGMTDQDARLVGRAWEAGRGIVLLANKWDLVPAARRDRAAFRD